MKGRPRLQRNPRRSLQRRFSLSFALLVTALLATALVCSVAVVWATAYIHRGNERVAALQVANRDVLQDMTDAQSGLRGHLLGNQGEPASERYVEAMQQLRADERRLRALADDARLLRLLDRQERANEAWLTDYAAPMLSSVAGRPTGESVADDLFADVTAANRAVATRIDEVTAETTEGSATTLGIVLAAVLLLPLLTLGAVAVVVRRTGRAVVAPLSDIAKVLERLRAGDLEARAEVTGPTEIREIASALNSLTDENVRAGEVEADVLSRLESIDRVRTDLVSTVSHELRTPLTSVIGYWELLEDDLSADASAPRVSMMGVIRRNLDRLNELVANLLVLSRAEETRLSREPVDLRLIAAEVTADIRLQAAARDIKVQTVQAACRVTVLGDASQLTRAVQNLVTNAVKFSRPGGIVEVRVREEGHEAVLEVADEGIGIPLADLDGLGSRFFRGSNAMRAEIAGTGLGLRIVQTILDRHEGTLGVESVEGEGSTFMLRLPLAAGTNSRHLAVVWQTGSPTGSGSRALMRRDPAAAIERTS